jgi:hypothetical protein
MSGALLRPASLHFQAPTESGNSVRRLSNSPAGALPPGRQSGRCCQLPLRAIEDPHTSYSRHSPGARCSSVSTWPSKRGWLRAGDIVEAGFAQNSVEFERVLPWKWELLREAFAGFRATEEEVDLVEFEAFSAANSAWLESHADTGKSAGPSPGC